MAKRVLSLLMHPGPRRRWVYLCMLGCVMVFWGWLWMRRGPTMDMVSDDVVKIGAPEVERNVETIRKVGFMMLDAGNRWGHEDAWRSWLVGHENEYVFKIHNDKLLSKSPSEWYQAHRTHMTHPSQHGHPNLTLATNTMLKEALQEHPEIYKFVIICPLTVPLQSFEFVRDALLADEQNWLQPMIPDDYLTGYDKSSQWMVLNRPSVEAIVSEESWRELEKRVESKRAKWNILTDEFYFMTVVVEHHLWTNDSDRLSTWVAWGPHRPTLFEFIEPNSDIYRSMADSKRRGVLFARKITPRTNFFQLGFHNSTPEALVPPVYPRSHIFSSRSFPIYFPHPCEWPKTQRECTIQLD